MKELQAFIDKWKREADGYVMGTMLPSPVGDMNRASATVVRKVLAELESALAALVTEAPQELARAENLNKNADLQGRRHVRMASRSQSQRIPSHGEGWYAMSPPQEGQ